MGLRSFFRSVERTLQSVIAPILPLARELIPGINIFEAVVGPLVPAAAQPSRGASAVAQTTRQVACPLPGTVGNLVPSANPITRAAISPGFDVNRLPARSAFAGQAFGGFGVVQPRFQFPQTTGFAQQAFGGPVAPSFRPFTPSFRSGQFGFGGFSLAGISQGIVGPSPGRAASLPGGVSQARLQAFDPIFEQIVNRQPSAFGF